MSFGFRMQLKNLLSTGEFSDFTIIVEEQHFKVHRCVICPQSAFLQRLCSSEFKEGVEGCASLPEEKADVFRRVLDYLYTGIYGENPVTADLATDEPVDTSSDEDSPHISTTINTCPTRSKIMEIHTSVYLLAKYLDVYDLMRMATIRFAHVNNIHFNADDCLKSFTLMFNHGDDGKCGLRARMIEICLKNWKHVPADGELDRLLLKHEPIAWSMLSRQLKNQEDQVKQWEEKRKELEDAKEAMQVVIGNAEAQVETLREEMDDMLTLLDKHEQCRNCHKSFASSLDREERGVLRCRICHCRHF